MTDQTLGSRSVEPEENEDQVLGAAMPEDEPEFEDVTGELSAEDYDFGDFVDGSRATRYAVRPAMRGDLLAEMNMIVFDVEDAEKAGDTDRVEALAERYEQVKAEFEASRRVVVVEARSSHRRQQLEKHLVKQGLTRPGKKASAEEHTHFARELNLHLLADQIVFPTKGITVDALRRLFETNEPALDQIFQAAERANRNPAKAVTPDFLQGR